MYCSWTSRPRQSACASAGGSHCRSVPMPWMRATRPLTAVQNQLKSHGIDLPFPTQQILFHDQTEDSDGDRARQREGWPAGNTDVPASRKADAIPHLSGSKPRGAEGE